MNEEARYELISSDGVDDEVVAEFWWDGSKTCCTKPNMLKNAEFKHPLHYSSKSLKFFKTLGMVFKTPSLYLRKKQE